MTGCEPRCTATGKSSDVRKGMDSPSPFSHVSFKDLLIALHPVAPEPQTYQSTGKQRHH